MRRDAAGACAVLFLLLSACEAEPRALSWEIVMGTTDITDEIVVVQASIRRGGCDGPVVFQTQVRRMGAPPLEAPPRLSPDEYAFVALGGSQACDWIAAGCTLLQLPTEAATVTVALLDSSADGYCEPVTSRCESGVCEALDAGPPPIDTSIDADIDAETGVDTEPDPDTAPPGPTCDDGVQNGDETGVDCGGICDACPAWDVGAWSSCSSGGRSRSVSCNDFMGAILDDVECPAPKPGTTETCASFRSAGFGCPTTSFLEVLDGGDCADRPTCTGCPSLTVDQCTDYCLSVAARRGRRVTCELTGCTTECNAFDGFGIDTGCSGGHWMWYAYPP